MPEKITQIIIDALRYGVIGLDAIFVVWFGHHSISLLRESTPDEYIAHVDGEKKQKLSRDHLKFRQNNFPKLVLLELAVIAISVVLVLGMELIDAWRGSS